MGCKTNFDIILSKTSPHYIRIPQP